MIRSLHLVDDDGTPLDAAVRLESGTVPGSFELTFESRSGRRGSSKARNPDYLRALGATIARLAKLRSQIAEINITSKHALTLPVESRILPFAYPLSLSPQTDSDALRLAITNKQRSTARTSAAKSTKGGNNNKKICIKILCKDEIDSEFLANSLEGR